MSRGQPRGATPALSALRTAAIEFTEHPYPHDPRAASYGVEAAQRLGLDPATVLKTLVAESEGHLALALVPVSGELDLKALARALGASRARMAGAPVAERATGYVLGGVSPFGTRRALPTVVDSSALAHPRVYVSGGRRGLDVGLAPADLVRVARARTARIGR